MRKRNRNPLALFIVVSLVTHMGVNVLLSQVNWFDDEPQAKLAAIPLLRLPKPPEKPLPKPKPTAPTPPSTQRFRPNDTPEKTVEEKPPETPAPLAKKQEKTPQPTAEKPLARPDRMTPQEHDRYREQLLAHFEPDWTKIPDLLVKADPDTQRAVSRFFGMALIAYPKSEAKPAYAIVIDEEAAKYQYTRNFDFTRYSNRAKDRSNVRDYAHLVRKAKSRLAIPEELTIVSLVPAAADAYFAAKQMEAARAAGLPLDQVGRTEGHYAKDTHGRYLLIIDKVVTKQGKPIQVDDRERGAVATS